MCALTRACLPNICVLTGEDFPVTRMNVISDEFWAVVEPLMPSHEGKPRRLKVGDKVYFRHTKAGELCERFDRLHLVRGAQIVDTVPTYRGEGRTFL